MFDHYSDGYCPQCALKNDEVEMLLNIMDYWECPVCHLQAAGSQVSMITPTAKARGL